MPLTPCHAAAAWDGFTHPGGWAVERWRVLETSVSLGPAAVPVFKLLQHGSTLGGALALLAWTGRWWHRQPEAARRWGVAHRARAPSA